MQISEVLSITAVAIAAGSLAMTIWNIRRTTKREDGRDHADVVLRYTSITRARTPPSKYHFWPPAPSYPFRFTASV
ncbi:biopolymer transport protein ExbB/TolQ [Paenarthrobacter sp. A20]|nr:biopolymer transport protein ExbB/TolQ [Paenarthrobacter sp. A20]